MVSTLSTSDIPLTRVDCLHILAIHNDDLKTLSYAQKIAIRRIYFLDDDRTVEQRVRDGDLVLTQEDVRDFVEVEQ